MMICGLSRLFHLRPDPILVREKFSYRAQLTLAGTEECSSEESRMSNEDLERWDVEYRGAIRDFMVAFPDDELSDVFGKLDPLKRLSRFAFAQWSADKSQPLASGWARLDVQAMVAFLADRRTYPEPTMYAPLWRDFVRFLGRRGELTADEVSDLESRIAEVVLAAELSDAPSRRDPALANER